MNNYGFLCSNPFFQRIEECHESQSTNDFTPRCLRKTLSPRSLRIIREVIASHALSPEQILPIKSIWLYPLLTGEKLKATVEHSQELGRVEFDLPGSRKRKGQKGRKVSRPLE